MTEKVLMNMRVKFLVAVLLLSISPALAASMKETSAGCITKDDLDQLSTIAREEDKVAFTKMVYSGFCRMFNKGSRVFVEKTPEYEPIECVRPEGGVACFWVMRRSVSAQ